MIDISGLDRAEVLAALYNNSRPLGMGFLEYTSEPMSRGEAAKLLEESDYFDYLKGRVMKSHLPIGETQFDEWLYDRDNGQGAAAAAIEPLRKKG